MVHLGSSFSIAVRVGWTQGGYIGIALSVSSDYFSVLIKTCGNDFGRPYGYTYFPQYDCIIASSETSGQYSVEFTIQARTYDASELLRFPSLFPQELQLDAIVVRCAQASSTLGFEPVCPSPPIYPSTDVSQVQLLIPVAPITTSTVILTSTTTPQPVTYTTTGMVTTTLTTEVGLPTPISGTLALIVLVGIGAVAVLLLRGRTRKPSERRGQVELTQFARKKPTCVKCGATLLPKSKFCKECGASTIS
jgi:ribosomal protein S27AE